MSAKTLDQAPEFKTARQDLAAHGDNQSGDGHEPSVVSSSLVVAPEMDIAQAKVLWNKFFEFRGVILSDPACYDEIDGHKEMNRTGATRLALPFGLSIEERAVEEGPIQTLDNNEWDYRFRVRVRVSKGQRFVDGIGSCRLSEIPGKMDVSKKEHWAMTKAYTRAAKRAIVDMLGGSEAD